MFTSRVLLQWRRSQRHWRRRVGISLLEVLISIGVVSIGLTGLAFLIPVAHHQAQSGAQNDRKGNVGKRAYREFIVREMARPEHWRRWDVSNQNYFGPILNDQFFSRAVLLPDDPSIQDNLKTPGLRRLPVCLDPRAYAAVEALTSTTLIMPLIPAVNTTSFNSITTRDGLLELISSFPAAIAPTAGLPWMTRVTLTPAGLESSALPVMTSAQTDQIFVLQDELDFLAPSDVSLGPVQKTIRDRSGASNASLNSGAIISRASNGHFSWFATLVPILGSELEQGLDNDLYRLSIAVTYQRNIIEPEGIIAVNVAHGIGGGHVQQIFPNNGTPIAVPAGNWVMLANQATGQYRWYRVTNSDGANLSLEGEDWKPTPATVAPVNRDYLIYPPNVVNVYEKTIRLEYSSMWTR